MSRSAAGQINAGQIRLGRGPRAVEAALLEEVEACQRDLRGDPALLSQPLRIVVPSKSLRQHLAAALVAHVGGGLLGVRVQTLHSLALEILERAGEPLPTSSLLASILVRDFAREEPVLQARLGSLDDGFSVVRPVVDDLLDAGLEPAHAEALDERLAASAFAPGPIEVARAVVRVASRVAEAFAAEGVAHRSEVLRRASDVIARPAGAIPSRAILVHGFADATGVAADLLTALLRSATTTLWVDLPPRITAPGEVEPFARRFCEHLAISGADETTIDAASAPAPAVLYGFEAPGAAAELREVGRRIQELLVAGTQPESIAIVARDWSAYRLALRAQMRALAIPYSGVGEGLSGGTGASRHAAWLEVLQREGDVGAERWLDGVALPAAFEAADLRWFLRSRGAARLADVAKLRAIEKDVKIPVPTGHAPASGERAVEGAPLETVRRVCSAEAVGWLRERAELTLATLRGWPEQATADEHREHFAALLAGGFGWASGETAAVADDEVSAATTAVADELEALPTARSLRREDFLECLSRALASEAQIPLGGAGGGVRILGVMEARGCTFEHLFVVGLNRDVFPRPVREDPIIPDSLRHVMAELLPAIPIKQRGHEEERHLFAELLEAAAEVTISWQGVGDDARPRSVSTFVEALRWRPGGLTEARVDLPLRGPTERLGEAPRWRPAAERALEAALDFGAAGLAAGLPAALCEAQGGGDAAEPAYREAAIARLRVAAELDRSFGSDDLGPYLGRVGPLRRDDDPRRRRPYITQLEGLGRCPWQALLEKHLGIERVRDPLAGLPDFEAKVIGIAVHASLEAVFRAYLTDSHASLEALEPSQAVAVDWPDPTALRDIVQRETRRALAVAGLRFASFDAIVAERVLPRVQAARRLGWPDPGSVLGREVSGKVAVERSGGGTAEVEFRADRVDLGADGFVLSDYKTGRPISKGKKPSTRREHWLEKVRQGRHLQAVAYARARGEPGDAGRFLFLSADDLETEKGRERATFDVRGDDAEMRAAFDGAVDRLLWLAETGAYVPHLVSAKAGEEPSACKYCDVAEACLRGDSGASGRLGRWLEAPLEAGSPGESLRLALRALRDPGGEGTFHRGEQGRARGAPAQASPDPNSNAPGSESPGSTEASG